MHRIVWIITKTHLVRVKRATGQTGTEGQSDDPERLKFHKMLVPGSGKPRPQE